MPKKSDTYVYVVKQYQPSDGYDGEPIYVYTQMEDAEAAARNLNKTYGAHCKFTREGDFEETLSEENPHYYMVEPLLIDDHIPEVENLMGEKFIIEVWDDDAYYVSEYVAKDDMKTDDINEAKTFNTWDEAAAMIEVLEKLDLYEDNMLCVGRTK